MITRSDQLGARLRRCGKIIAVVVFRGARAGWYLKAGRFFPQEINQAGLLPSQLRHALEDLGPTFVKLGQLLSSRSDIISPQLQKELSKLQDHAPSIPRAQLMAELERSFGSGSVAPFSTLELAPVACGSIAQVHRGTLHNGHRVAVKVRRPGVRADIDTDVWLLRKAARLVAFLSPRVRAYDPLATLDEFAGLLQAETDFITEAQNLEAVGRTFACNDAVMIPRVLTDMSGESVLVMDWIEGIPLSDRERLEEVETNRAGLARMILQAYGVMIFQSDRFHADPHPGNLILIDGVRLGLVDFGEVGSLKPAVRSALQRMIAAMVSRDGEALADAVLSVSRTTRTVDRAEFGVRLSTLVERVADTSLKDMGLGEILGPIRHLLRDRGIVLPSDLAILIKTVIECEGTANELDPTMSMLNLVGDLGSPPAQVTPKTSPEEVSHEHEQSN